jgi:hypothetical protein
MTGKPSPACTRRANPGRWNRSQLAQNAAGSRRRAGTVLFTCGIHGLGSGGECPSRERRTRFPEYGARRAAYDTRKLRGKGMVQKIGASRRYETLHEGLRALTALEVLREKLIRPLLAASTRPQPHAKLSNPTLIDQHYENLRAGMRGLFNELGVAA